MPNHRRSAEGISLEAKNVVEEQKLTRIPINSFHGQSKFYCKQCAEFVFVAFLIKGKMPHPDFEDETIIVDVLEGDCGHEIADYSH